MAKGWGEGRAQTEIGLPESLHLLLLTRHCTFWERAGKAPPPPSPLLPFCPTFIHPSSVHHIHEIHLLQLPFSVLLFHPHPSRACTQAAPFSCPSCLLPVLFCCDFVVAAPALIYRSSGEDIAADIIAQT